METKASNSGKFNYRCRAQTLSSECFYTLVINLKCTDQVLLWERGPPARLRTLASTHIARVCRMRCGAGRRRGTRQALDAHLTTDER